MKIKAYITTEVFDRNGKRVYYRRRRSRSFVKAFMALLLAQFSGGGTQTTLLNTSGASKTVLQNAINFGVYGGAGVTTYGTRVGTVNTPVNAADYALATAVAHGVGSGQLSHSATTLSSLSTADPNNSFTIQRDFTNSSGGTITVWEEGLYVYGRTTVPSDDFFCAVRDVESSGVSVADGQNLRVTYTLQTST